MSHRHPKSRNGEKNKSIPTRCPDPSPCMPRDTKELPVGDCRVLCHLRESLQCNIGHRHGSRLSMPVKSARLPQTYRFSRTIMARPTLKSSVRMSGGQSIYKLKRSLVRSSRRSKLPSENRPTSPRKRSPRTGRRSHCKSSRKRLTFDSSSVFVASLSTLAIKNRGTPPSSSRSFSTTLKSTIRGSQRSNQTLDSLSESSPCATKRRVLSLSFRLPRPPRHPHQHHRLRRPFRTTENALVRALLAGELSDHIQESTTISL